MQSVSEPGIVRAGLARQLKILPELETEPRVSNPGSSPVIWDAVSLRYTSKMPTVRWEAGWYRGSDLLPLVPDKGERFCLQFTYTRRIYAV